MKRLIALLFVLSFSPVTAQYKSSIAVLGKPKDDGVWIRWAPASPSIWQLGNKYGYLIERFTVLPDGNLENPVSEKLTASPLKPYSPEQLAQLSKTVKEAGVLTELIHDNNVTQVRSNDPTSLLARNQDTENKYGVALLVCDLWPEVAKAAALFFIDKTAVKGKRYIYRISLGQKPLGSVVEPGVLVLDVTDEKPLEALKDVKAEFRNRTVSITWSTMLHYGIYSSYYIEKSEDGKNFKRLSKLPYVHMSEKIETEAAFYVDSLEANNKTYYYRIAGISPFGELGPPSNVVSGAGRDDLAGYIVIREGKISEDRKVSITWEFPQEGEKSITGFVLCKSNNAGGPYQDINKVALAKTTREYVDAISFNNTYYILKAVDETGNELSQSFPFLVHEEDNTPPINPTGLSGAIDKNGVAKIQWKANQDEDLMGYRVFRSNSREEEFIEMTKTLISTTEFTDTLKIKVLNKKIFYRVVAVDKNYNNSEFSEILQLEKPDVVPPIPPVFTKAEVDKGTINLQWINSTSNDIVKTTLVRLDKEIKVTRILRTWASAPLENVHTELSLTPGITYQYKLIVYDSSGNSAESVSPQLHFETGFRNSLTNVTATVDRDNREIKLEWKNQEAVVKCLIYRKVNDESLVLYKTLEGNINNFSDKNVAINNKYAYKIQVTYSSKIKSRLSEEIRVIY